METENDGTTGSTAKRKGRGRPKKVVEEEVTEDDDAPLQPPKKRWRKAPKDDSGTESDGPTVIPSRSKRRSGAWTSSKFIW